MAGTLPNTFMLSIIQLDTDAPTPLYRQIYDGIRAAIVENQLKPGVRLPSSRDLAETLGVSRNTIMNAVDQLIAEGYLETRTGAGTFVTTSLPDDLPGLFARPQVDTPQTHALRDIADRAEIHRDSKTTDFRYTPRSEYAFFVGTPDLDAFPFHIWAQMTARHYRYTPPGDFNYYPSAAGYRPLREAIAEYLQTSRALRCEPEQVIIVSGSQQALHLAAHILLDPGAVLWMEDPGYGGARGAFNDSGVQMIPIPVDAEGMDIDYAIAHAPPARAVYITPSHQFPLGHTMSLARRLRLIQWAQEQGAWIVEDDYDSEFRYGGHPVAALQGLDRHQRVIYAGTFSKVLFPALRLGYLVVPLDLVTAFVSARRVIDQHPPLIPQAVTAEFIRSGHFMRHIRRMRKTYSHKRDVLLDGLSQALGDWLRPIACDSGMHITALLPDAIDDVALALACAANHVDVLPLSPYYQNRANVMRGLVIGYAAASPDAIQRGIERLTQACAGFR